MAPMILFSSRGEGADHWKETLQWLTDIITNDDDSEQRITLRSKPRRVIEFSAKSHSARETALMANVIWGNQPIELGFPVWTDRLWLAANVTTGGTSLTVNTTLGGTVNREFVADGFLVLWTDPFTWEIRTIASVTPPGTIAIDALVNDWSEGALVIPMTVATLSPSLSGRRVAAPVQQLSITANCDVLLDTAMVSAATWSGTQYNGLDLLTTMPDGVNGQLVTIKRTMLKEDSDTGIFTYLAPTTTPVPTRTFQWFLNGRTAIAQFKGFLANRQGRYVAFWAPTWRQDLALALPVASTDTTITIKSCGYSEYVFPSSTARQFLALIGPDYTVTPAQVTASVDNGDGTETLKLSAVSGATLDTTTSLVSFLTAVRLASDAITIEYPTSQFASVSTPLDEVPHEAIISAGAGGVVLTQTAMTNFGASLIALGGIGATDPAGDGGEGLPELGIRAHQLADDFIGAPSGLVCCFENGGGVWYSNHIFYSQSGGTVTFWAYDYNTSGFVTLFTIATSALTSGTYLTVWLDYVAATGIYRWGLSSDDGLTVNVGLSSTATGRYNSSGGSSTPTYTDPHNTRVDLGVAVSGLATATQVQHFDGFEVRAQSFNTLYYVIPAATEAGRPGLWTFDTDTLAEFNGGTSLNMLNGATVLTPTYQAGGTWGTQ
jgi:hypothetical protein